MDRCGRLTHTFQRKKKKKKKRETRRRISLVEDVWWMIYDRQGGLFRPKMAFPIPPCYVTVCLITGGGAAQQLLSGHPFLRVVLFAAKSSVIDSSSSSFNDINGCKKKKREWKWVELMKFRRKDSQGTRENKKKKKLNRRLGDVTIHHADTHRWANVSYRGRPWQFHQRLAGLNTVCFDGALCFWFPLQESNERRRKWFFFSASKMMQSRRQLTKSFKMEKKKKKSGKMLLLAVLADTQLLLFEERDGMTWEFRHLKRALFGLSLLSC